MKDTFYFPHDSEPTSDPKIIAMLGDYGATGYGLYWRIVEMLHSNENNALPKEKYIYKALSCQMATPVEQIEQFVEDCLTVYKLFEGDDNCFFSGRVLRNIDLRNKSIEQRSLAGKKSAQKRAEQKLENESDF